MKAVSKFSYMTIDGIDYFEPEETMTYDEAIEWASTRGLRLLTRGEWCDLFDHKEEFRKSCKPQLYWTNSVYWDNPTYAWFFNPEDSLLVYNSYPGALGKVRAVQIEPEANYGY
jgi:hypothetical protein